MEFELLMKNGSPFSWYTNGYCLKPITTPTGVPEVKDACKWLMSDSSSYKQREPLQKSDILPQT